MRARLPILLSVPHAGLEVPAEFASRCALSPRDVARDGDEGARDIYALVHRVEAFVTTPLARAIVDLNRSEEDRGRDGVVKTHTCWEVPVWRDALSEEEIERLLSVWYRPYHERLSALAGRVRLGVDGHTMAAVAPPVAPDAGAVRPMVCIGDGHGACPRRWAQVLRECFARRFPGEVTLNEPFSGGHITRAHGCELPWVQVELSRDPALDHVAKRQGVLAALDEWCRLVL